MNKLRITSLTLKVLMLTIIVGAIVWSLTDYFGTKAFRDLLEGQLAEELSQQAEEDRNQFDQYVKFHRKTTRLLSEHNHLLTYLEEQRWYSDEPQAIKFTQSWPVWLPKVSIMRSLIQLRYVLLLDDQHITREVYRSESTPLPPSLLNPDAVLLQLSNTQPYLTSFDGVPYIVATHDVHAKRAGREVLVVLISPVDEQFLTFAQGSSARTGKLVALLTGEPNKLHIQVSSDLTQLPPGTEVESLQDDYLVTGQAFFDYGDSDMAIKFASFISTAQIEMLTNKILLMQRKQIAITAFVIIVALSLIMLWITRRIQDLTRRVIDFSVSMNLSQPELIKGDQLIALEERFQWLTKEIVRETEALEYQALHDPLTGLANSTLLKDRIDQIIREANRDKKSFALFMLDLNRFKEINDTLGHHVGDRVLQEIAKFLSGLFRESDAVARFGGDEFAILLRNSSLEQSITIAKRILRVIDEPFLIDGSEFHTSISIGIAHFPEHGNDTNNLLRKADVAMYTAKHKKQGYSIYDSVQDQHSLTRLKLMGDLSHAIQANILETYYQPKIIIDTGQIASVEVLLRWQQDGKFIPPMEFIPIAEQTGLIHKLDMWVLNNALHEYAKWRQDNINISFAINLSTRSLHDRKLPNQLATLMDVLNIPPTNLTLEITESAIMTDPVLAKHILGLLDNMGIQLSIDDFGTGYSSLAYLKQLPVDELKIDRGFVMNMLNDRDDAVIVRATIDLAHNLGLRVVAEGVESEEIMDKLKLYECDLAQGYGICKPLPASEFLQWLNDSGRKTIAQAVTERSIP